MRTAGLSPHRLQIINNRNKISRCAWPAFYLSDMTIDIMDNQSKNAQTMIKTELQEIESKYALIIEELKKKNEEIQKLKENALIMTGAKAVLTKLVDNIQPN